MKVNKNLKKGKPNDKTNGKPNGKGRSKPQKVSADDLDKELGSCKLI